MISNSNELFGVEFWDHLHLERYLPLLVWEQAITHAFKAKPNCQVSGSSPCPLNLEKVLGLLLHSLQILFITDALPTNLPQQTTTLSQYAPHVNL